MGVRGLAWGPASVEGANTVMVVAGVGGVQLQEVCKPSCSSRWRKACPQLCFVLDECRGGEPAAGLGQQAVIPPITGRHRRCGAHSIPARALLGPTRLAQLLRGQLAQQTHWANRRRRRTAAS